MVSFLSRYKLSEYKNHWPLLFLVLLGLYNAFGNVFIQDDAYISYNYAKWFSRGYGLVWYPGSSEFGFTSFFYSLMIGVAMVFAIPPEFASNTINMASFMACLVLVYQLARIVLGSSFPALITVLLLATHHSFTAYATGGLETMWTSFLILAFYWRVLTLEEGSAEKNTEKNTEKESEKNAQRNYLIIGTVAALALLSRLDSAVLLFPGYVYLLYRAALISVSIDDGLKRIFPAIIIPAATTIGFLIVCYLAYGNALPNSFYIKMPGSESMAKYGLRYLWLYNILHMYLPLFVPLLIIYFFAGRGFFRRLGGQALLLATTLLLWIFYIIYVGGDFMEFRFLVSVLPFYYIVVIRLIQALLPKYITLTIIAVTGAFLLGNFTHSIPRVDLNPAVNIKHFYKYGVKPTEILDMEVNEKPVNWKVVGKKLRELFYTGNDSDVKIAMTAAGAIAYFSDLHTIDQLGLNTRAVLYNYKQFTNLPGHNIRVTNDYMTQIGVNIVVDHPVYFQKVMHCQNDVNFAAHVPINNVRKLYIPLNKRYLLVYYLTPHARIDELIAQRKIFPCRK